MGNVWDKWKKEEWKLGKIKNKNKKEGGKWEMLSEKWLKKAANQHGVWEYDDSQNWLDMASYENLKSVYRMTR